MKKKNWIRCFSCYYSVLKCIKHFVFLVSEMKMIQFFYLFIWKFRILINCVMCEVFCLRELLCERIFYKEITSFTLFTRRDIVIIAELFTIDLRRPHPTTTTTTTNPLTTTPFKWFPFQLTSSSTDGFIDIISTLFMCMYLMMSLSNYHQHIKVVKGGTRSLAHFNGC